MISGYIVVEWSHSPRWGYDSSKHMECDTYDEACTLAKREVEYLDTIGREYEINIYVNESLLEEVLGNSPRHGKVEGNGLDESLGQIWA